MMPNVTRGDRMGGLLSYLVGPGRANEHTEPHLVAGDEPVMAWHDDAELDRVSALEVARHLDRPRALYGVEVPGGSVWHCSLSLRAEEGQLDDGKWADISRDFVDRMGFTEASGKAPCRWVAVRHGLSTAGNDHVHLVVSLVRQDGTKANTWKDFARAQQVAGELEKKYGLEVVESRDADRGTRGVSPAEQARAERSGALEPERLTLARSVRAVAGAAPDEAAFVTGLREQGMWVRARYAAGRDDVVTGYSVAAKPAPGQRPVWFGGGHLGRDLTIARLRQGWPDSPEASQAAVAQWQAARRGQPAGRARGPRVTVGDEHLVACTREVEAMRAHLASLDPADRAGWAHAARQTSGALAAWSNRVEAKPGRLARSSDALARYSQTRAHVEAPRAARAAARPSLRGTTLMLMTAADNGRGRAAEAVLVRQLLKTAQAIHDAQVASGQARSAAHLAATVKHELRPVMRERPVPEWVSERGLDGSRPVVASTGTAQEHEDARRIADFVREANGPMHRPLGSPVPERLAEPTRAPQAPARPGPDRGVER
uniref:relaxase/mobilization nuclease domain-containing protein n=2 Tax=Pseudokineococcus sp. 5B2Z-1 TaxID=3132744 RepID=UPI0030DC9B71